MQKKRLTNVQWDLLRLLGNGPRTDITDTRAANALKSHGLATWKTKAPDAGWHITDRGRAVLSEHRPANGRAS
jgi:hypothetical protein